MPEPVGLVPGPVALVSPGAVAGSVAPGIVLNAVVGVTDGDDSPLSLALRQIKSAARATMMSGTTTNTQGGGWKPSSS